MEGAPCLIDKLPKIIKDLYYATNLCTTLILINDLNKSGDCELRSLVTPICKLRDPMLGIDL